MIFTVVATVAVEDEPLLANAIEDAVREALGSVGASLVPCDWAPDPDTITEACRVPYYEPPVEVIDLNPSFAQVERGLG